MRVVIDDDVDRRQVYNGDIKPSRTNYPNLFLVAYIMNVALFLYQYVNGYIKVVILLRSHPFPFRTGSLSSVKPMVLHLWESR